MSKWIDVNQELPSYGVPILLKGNGVTQHVTYMLDGGDDCPDWFEPYHFEHDDNMKILWNKTQAWQLLPE